MKIKSSFGISLLVSLFVAACSDNSNSISVPQESSCSDAIVSSSSEESSSSSIESSSAESSSSEVSSSSYVEKHLAWDYLNPAISYGEFTDKRDGRVYKYMEYKTLRLMAENMNYSDSIASPNLKGSTWCPHDNLDSCSKYGRLYTWAAAMNLDSSYNVKGYNFIEVFLNHQGICPEGWTIYANKFVWQNISFGDVSDGQLCSIKGWTYPNCSDSIGFSALPNGYREEGVMHRLDSTFTYWTLIFETGDEASLGEYGMWDDFTFWNAVSMSKKIGGGVRCMQTIKNKESSSSSVGESSNNSLE